MPAETHLRNDLIVWVVSVFAVAVAFGGYLALKYDWPSGLATAANTSKDKRHAQNLASVCSSAIAAGSVEFDLVTSEWAAVSILRRGTHGSDSFYDTHFQVPGMTDKEARKAMRHLIWHPAMGSSDGYLEYRSDHGLKLVDTPPPPQPTALQRMAFGPTYFPSLPVTPYTGDSSYELSGESNSGYPVAPAAEPLSATSWDDISIFSTE